MATKSKASEAMHRIASELGIAECARRLQCVQSYISHLRRGLRRPSRTVAVRAAQELDIPVEWWEEEL